METREELIAGLKQAVNLLQQCQVIWTQQDALTSQLTPPAPFIPEKKPIKGGKTALLWLIVGAIDFLLLMPVLTGVLTVGFVSNVPVESVANEDTVNAVAGASVALFVLSLVIWVVGSIVIKRVWNKRVAKKNATIAEQNQAIAAENATRKPQDAPIYEQLDALEVQMAPIREEWATDIAPWYPQDYMNVTDATELLHLVEGHRANTMTEAINTYETIQHQQRMELSQQQIIDQQEQIKRNQKMQIFLQGVTAAASIQGAASAAQTASNTARTAANSASIASSSNAAAHSAATAADHIGKIRRDVNNISKRI